MSHPQYPRLVADPAEARSGDNQDTLTGLPNRNLLGNFLDMAIRIARRNSVPLGVIFIDLDRFKQVNDSLGHAMGDRLLQQVAARLQALLRDSDVVARWGGDEFVAVLPAIGDEADAGLIGLRIIEELSRPFDLDGSDAQIGASLGLALYPRDGRDSATLLHNADLAMYRAKRDRLDRLQFFDDVLLQQLHERQQAEAEMREALARGQLCLAPQPVLDDQTGQTALYDLDLRWHHPERGLLQADTFVNPHWPAGLLRQLDRWQLHRACNDLAASKIAPSAVPVCLNLHSPHPVETLSVAWLDCILAETGADPSRLVLGLPGSSPVLDHPETQAWAQLLRARGIGLAINDFSAARLPLAQLDVLGVRYLPLSVGRDSDLGRPANRALVQTVIDLGRNFGIEVFARGVSNREASDRLLAMGCRLLQGTASPDSAVENLPASIRWEGPGIALTA
jgi:diguanylate cyclase (GGDEF)-like protein